MVVACLVSLLIDQALPLEGAGVMVERVEVVRIKLGHLFFVMVFHSFVALRACSAYVSRAGGAA